MKEKVRERGDLGRSREDPGISKEGEEEGTRRKPGDGCLWEKDS